MKRKALLVLSILAALWCACAFATEVEATWQHVNVRQTPGGKVITRVNYGDVLAGLDEVYADDGLWYQIHSDQFGDGYISADFARPVWNRVYLYQEQMTGVNHVTDNMIDYLSELNAYLYEHGFCRWDAEEGCLSVVPIGQIQSTPENAMDLACMLLRHGMLVENEQTAVLLDPQAEDSERAQAASTILKKHYGTDDLGEITYRGNVATGFHPSDWHTPDMASNEDISRLRTMLDQVNERFMGQEADAGSPSAVSPSTVLYFNPDGGSRYHIDRNCPSISAKYLPLSGQFLWEQINEAEYRSLVPCNLCGAPVREADTP